MLAIAFLVLWAAPSLALAPHGVGDGCLLPIFMIGVSLMGRVGAVGTVICPSCQNNAPSCQFAVDGSECPTDTVMRSNAKCCAGVAAAGTLLSLAAGDTFLIKPEYQRVLHRNNLETVVTLVKKNVPGCQNPNVCNFEGSTGW